MKVAFITINYLAYDGLGRVTIELARIMAKLGHEIHVFAHKWKLETEDYRIHFHKIPAWDKAWSLRTITFFFTSWFFMQFWKRKFHIIHVQGFSWLKAQVVTSHGVYRAGLDEFHSMKNRVELGVKKKTIRRIEILLYFLEYNFKKGNHIKTVATSNQVKKELIKYIKTPENNIAFIPNGVDVIKFQPDNIVRYRNIMRNELQINEKDFVFLFIGNDPRRKGLLTVLDAFTGIPEQDASLVIVGEDLNDPEAFEFYKRRAAGTEKKSKIRFLPIRDDIERLFAAADAFVFPSLYESFGLVVLEAMASGIPVAASRTGAFEDIIENGVNGFLVNDPLDVKELSVLMSEMKNSPEKLKKISVMGRKQALNYSWENIAVQTLKLYEEILSVNVSRGS